MAIHELPISIAATGRCVPANLVFGELADDDMCILPGLFYDCPAEGPCVTGAPGIGQ